MEWRVLNKSSQVPKRTVDISQNKYILYMFLMLALTNMTKTVKYSLAPVSLLWSWTHKAWRSYKFKYRVLTLKMISSCVSRSSFYFAKYLYLSGTFKTFWTKSKSNYMLSDNQYGIIRKTWFLFIHEVFISIKHTFQSYFTYSTNKFTFLWLYILLQIVLSKRWLICKSLKNRKV